MMNFGVLVDEDTSTFEVSYIEGTGGGNLITLSRSEATRLLITLMLALRPNDESLAGEAKRAGIDGMIFRKVAYNYAKELPAGFRPDMPKNEIIEQLARVQVESKIGQTKMIDKTEIARKLIADFNEFLSQRGGW